MKQLIYAGKFHPWSEKNENDLFEALGMFDKIIIAVTKISKKPLRGQPRKLLDSSLEGKVKFVYFNKLSDVLNHFKSYKYIMFERR